RRAVCDPSAERLGRAAETWFAPPPHTHAARLERLIESLVAFYGRDPLNARILCHGLLGAHRRAPWSASGGELPPVLAHFVPRFVAFVTSGIAAGAIPPPRPSDENM